MKLGLLSYKDHEVFGEVADLLQDRSIDVEYLDPEEYHPPERLDCFNGLIAKKSRKAAFRTLRDAEYADIPTYNGFLSHMKMSHNPASYWHISDNLEVPEWSTFEKIDSEMVKKPRTETMSIEPSLVQSFEHDAKSLYQRYVENDGIDHKLYGVRLQEGIGVEAVDTSSKLLSDAEERKNAEVDNDFQAIVESAIECFDANMIGVDVISPPESNYVVDVNAAPSFRGTNMEPVLAESIENFLEGEI